MEYSPTTCIMENLESATPLTRTPKRRTMKDMIKTTATPKKAVKRQRLFTESPSGKAIRQSLEKSKKAEDIQTKIIDLRSNLQDNMNIEYLSSCDMQTKLTLLHLILGLPTLLTLISSYIHVPQMFPNRLSYILKIVNEDSSVTFSAEDMLVFIQTLESCANLLNNYSIDIVNILWKVSAKYKESFMKFETPPVTVCIQDDCQGTLYPSSKTSVTFYTLIGPCPGQKATLRCRTCQTYYNIDGFHVTNQGTYYYPVQYTTKWIRASNLVYFSKDLHEFMCEAANHAFVSSQGFAEIYNSVFTEYHPVAVNFHQWAKQLPVQIDPEPSTVNLYEATNLFDEDDFHKQNSADANTSVQISMTRKNTVSALLNGELQNELYERGLTDLTVFTTTNNREDIMREIDILRKTELYVHTEDDCSPLCKAKGCEHLRVIDSCWKVCMCHCMFAVPMEVKGYPLLNFPNVCTMEPQHGSVFCIEHHQLLARHKIPTDKQEFLKFIGCTERPKSSHDIKKVDDKLTQFAADLYIRDEEAKEMGESALSYQGTLDMVSNMETETWDNHSMKDEDCNKDTGEKARLRQRSRGHLVSVTGGGHIQYFDPIFKSESPSQVFMQVIRLMYLEFKDVEPHKLHDAIQSYVLSYDNMCHLDQLKAARDPLPLPAPYDTMWLRINKIIDRLHLPNHKQGDCKIKYNPDDLLPDGYNTMVAEQTFSWFSRFKKIANSLSQVHHLFYVHRNIKRRNNYTSRMHRAGKTPVLPGVNKTLAEKYA